MKKIFYTAFSAIILLSSQGAFANDKKNPVELSEKDQLRLTEITHRVEEIKAMDKSELSSKQRSELRKELKQIKHEANKLSGGGVYISATAILIIILLILIL